MTTSPFGAPNQFGTAPAAPTGPAPAAAPPAGSSRKPLLYVLGGVAAVAAVGAGAFFLLAPGDSDAPAAAAPAPRGSGTVAEPETEPVVPDEPTLVTQSSRNPFAALVLPGGAGAPATAPEASGGSSTGSTSGGSASAGSAPGAAGADGQDGEPGARGEPGPRGEKGAKGDKGEAPAWVTITVVDVDEATNTVDAIVRDRSGETVAVDVAVTGTFGPSGSNASKVTYTLLGTDLDGDLEVDFVELAVNGIEYTAYVGQPFVTYVD